MTRLTTARARTVFAVLLVLWCAASFTLSSRSDPYAFVHVPHVLNDKVEHGIEYATGGFLAAGAFGFLAGRRPVYAAITFCGLWGISDEWHQSYVPGRDCSPYDQMADVVGGTIGAFTFAVASARAQERGGGVDESDKQGGARRPT